MSSASSLHFTSLSISYADFATTRNQKPEIEIGVGPDGRGPSGHPGRATMNGDIRAWLVSVEAAMEHDEATPTTAKARRLHARSVMARNRPMSEELLCDWYEIRRDPRTTADITTNPAEDPVVDGAIRRFLRRL